MLSVCAVGEPDAEALARSKYLAGMSVEYVDSQDQLARVARELAGSQHIGLDFETSGLDVHTDVPWLMALSQAHSNVVHVVDTQRTDISILKDILEGTLLIGANFSFDLKFLRKLGIRPRRVACVITMGRALTAGLNQKNGLTDLCLRYHGFRLTKDVRKTFVMHPSHVRRLPAPPRWTDEQIYYAAVDAYVLEHIYHLEWVRAECEGIEHTIELENDLVPVVADMEYEGIYVDEEMWSELVEHAKAERMQLYSQLADMLSIEDTQVSLFPEITGSEFSINPNQLQDMKRRFAALGIDVDSLDKGILKGVSHPVAKAYIRWKEQDKVVGTYGARWIARKNPTTGRIHSNINQLGAEASGRFSSDDPNIQNVPDNKHNKYPRNDPRWNDEHMLVYDPKLPDFSYRHCFRPRPGYKFCDCDYSQMELRILAQISGDENMIAAFRSGEDLHSKTASLMFHLPLSECGKDSRWRKTGKAQPLDSKVLTPTGWRRFGDLVVGDLITGSDGKPTRVVDIFPQGMKSVFEVVTSDGGKTICCDEHLWAVECDGRVATMELSEIRKALRTGNTEWRYAVPLVEPVEFEPRGETLLDPYLLGLLLGDGSFRGRSVTFAAEDPELLDAVGRLLPDGQTLKHHARCDYYILGHGRNGRGHAAPLMSALVEYGLWGKHSHDKFVPDAYKYADPGARLAILQGLMDTDGSCHRKVAEFCSTSSALADDVVFLVRSLGGTARKFRNSADVAWRVVVRLDELNPFRLPRKALEYGKRVRRVRRKIVDVVELPAEVECQCIMVDAPDHLYVTDDFVVTHNTINFAIAYGKGPSTLADDLGIYDEVRVEWRAARKRFTERMVREEGIKRAKAVLEAYFKVFPKVRRWLEWAEQQPFDRGYTLTVMGRKRWFTRLDEKKLPKEELARQRAGMRNQGRNTPVQGGNADITKIAMVSIARRLFDGGWDAFLVNTIHDELLVEVREDQAAEVAEIVSSEMIRAGERFLTRVPVEADPVIADMWAKA